MILFYFHDDEYGNDDNEYIDDDDEYGNEDDEYIKDDNIF